MHASHVYVARRKCGCVVTLIADSGDKFTAKEVARCILNGLAIQREPIEKVWNKEILLQIKCEHETSASEKGKAKATKETEP